MNFLRSTIPSRIWTCLLVGGTLLGCADDPVPPEQLPTPRLVLLYATCSLNRDFIEPYDPTVRYTPNLAAFGRQAIVFDRHNTEAGKSAVAFSSIYTGTQAHTHGVYLQAMRMRDDPVMLTEAFAEQGYDTFFWDNHPLAKKALNFAQGVAKEHVFSLYGEPGNRARDTNFTAESPKFQAILERLRSDPSYRVLIIANNAVPHSPYLVSELDKLRRDFPNEVPDIDRDRIDLLGKLYLANYRGLQNDFHRTIAQHGLETDDVSELVAIVEAAYKVGVAELDTIFGGIVAAIDDHGLRNQSLIAFTSDHGELLFRDNALTRWAHGWELAPEDIQVPLMIRLPDPSETATRYPGVTRSIDLYPTLVGLSGFEIDAEWGVEGVDLAAAATGRIDPPDLLAYFHTVPPNHRVLKNIPKWESLAAYYPSSEPELMWVGVRSRDTVVYWRPDETGEWSFAAFDLASDPTVSRDLFDAGDPEHAALADGLRDYRSRLIENFTPPKRRGARSDEEEMLRSLGYVQ
jgi:arylsulfatase A-like enzyme